MPRCASILFAAVAVAAAVPFPSQAQQYRAFWVDAFHSGYKSPAQVEQLLEDIGRARVNAIFVQVRRRADSYYVRTLEVPAEDPDYATDFDALEYLIERAHARGVEVHAWFVVYPLWLAGAPPPLNPEHLYYKHGPGAQGRDMWMSVSSKGAVGTSLDPGHPGATRYLAGVITDPIRHYDLDGIHLDYIRYPEDAEYGWNPVAVERYQRLFRAGIPQPRDAAFSEFRRRQVTDLVRQIYLRAVEMKPSIKISAALVSWGNGPSSDTAWTATDAFTRVFQDWKAWLKEGILDLAMPMHYVPAAGNTALDRWLEFAKDRQFGRGYIPSLAPYLNPIPDSLVQIRRALRSSSAGNNGLGFALYSYASTHSRRRNSATSNAQFYTRLGQLFGSPAAVPVLPWKVAPQKGHLAGVLRVEGGPDWLSDGATVVVSSDTGRELARSTITDGTGFFGFVDLPPDRYRLKIECAGKSVYPALSPEVAAGRVTRFDVSLKASGLLAPFDTAAQPTKLDLHGAGSDSDSMEH